MDKVKLSLSPEQILSNSLINKGIAFTQEERDSLGLNGLLPYHIASLEEQVKRRYQNFLQERDDLSKYTFLSNLQNRNEILFYRLVSDHISEMLPLIYTPTIGNVSLEFSTLYNQARGIYFSYPLKDRIDEIVAHIPNDQIDVIVVTDGERILGLGDMGIGGMAIPQGKAALYTVFGGIHPSRVLPVMLDVGTNNPELLANSFYLGWQHERIRGQEYDDFIDLFVKAIRKRYPKVLIQWEDFAKLNSYRLLEKYKTEVCSFNDDIQGTAAVTLAGILSAIKACGSEFKDLKIAVLGGGSAGLGISQLIIKALTMEGLTQSQALANFYIVDKEGLLHDKLPHIEEAQKPFAQNSKELANWKLSDPSHISLLEVIENAHPQVLIGVSTQQGAFTEEIVKAMLKFTPRPIIFPLSNPSSKSEANPKDLINWTQGKAIVATGSPFAPVQYYGKEYLIAQCNNVSIFPGVGLGIVASQTPKVIEKMFIRAAYVLSEHSPLIKDPNSMLFPPLEELRSVSRSIAIEVMKVAQEEGLSPKTTLKEIEKRVDETMWSPNYPTYTVGR